MENSIEKAAKEVTPTSLASLTAPDEINFSELINTITNKVDRNLGDEILRGRAKQGIGSSDSLSLIRDFLLEEIDSLKLSTVDDNKTRISNDKFKDGLRKSVNNIVSILELSTERKDIKYFMLGALLKAL